MKMRWEMGVFRVLSGAQWGGDEMRTFPLKQQDGNDEDQNHPVA